jgi:hypothetical protein
VAKRRLIDTLRAAAADVARLVRLEAALASERARGAARRAGISTGIIGMGMTFAFLGLLLLLGAAAASLAIVLPVWASLLIVGGGAVALGGALAVGGLLGLRRASNEVGRTADRVKEDLRWVRERTS